MFQAKYAIKITKYIIEWNEKESEEKSERFLHELLDYARKYL